MKIGRLEIRWLKDPIPWSGAIDVGDDKVDRTPVFAVPDTEPWWLAVHQVLNQAEKESVEGARNRLANTNMCIAAVGAIDGVVLVRQKLMAAREIALKGRESMITSTSMSRR
jgi:hypothetical protein